MSGTHVTDEQLVGYASGDLGAQERSAVEQAIVREPDLAERLRRMRRALTVLASDDTRHPRPAAVRRAVALLDARPANALLAWLERVEREIARVVFDSRAGPALVGFRGDPSTHQLSFESDLARIDLQVVPDEADASRARLRGQVTPTAKHVPGTIVAAPTGAASDAALLTGEPDEHGQFSMTVEAGQYAMHFEFNDGARAVTIPDLDIP